MPFTLLHLGPALFLGMIFLRYIDLPTFLVANVIVDIEPLAILALSLNRPESLALPLHGMLHTFLGGALVALPLASTMTKMGKFTAPLMGLVGVDQGPSLRNVFWTALSGVCLHVILDSRLYADMRPFYPLSYNPFLGGVMDAFEIWWLCIATGLIGVALLVFRLARAHIAR